MFEMLFILHINTVRFSYLSSTSIYVGVGMGIYPWEYSSTFNYICIFIYMHVHTYVHIHFFFFNIHNWWEVDNLYKEVLQFLSIPLRKSQLIWLVFPLLKISSKEISHNTEKGLKWHYLKLRKVGNSKWLTKRND